MLQGFKEFVLRGNLVELSVAFVMGTAFATVVTATVTLVMSLVAKVSGGPPDFTSFTPWGLPVGEWLTALVSFLILAAVVYFLVVTPYNRLQARRDQGTEPEPPAEEVTVLKEIRDLLAARH